MNHCPERDLLRDADPIELTRALEQIDTGSLASHFAECASCREAAARLLAADEALDRTLSTVPPVDAAAVLERARSHVPTAPRGWSSSRRRSSVGKAASALAAAAALAAVFLLGERDRPMPGTAFTAVAEAPVELDVEGDADLAVLQTDNPDITVVWFFSGE